MLRGFRWQFLALVLALILFGVALGNRILTRPQPVQVTATPDRPAATQTTAVQPTPTPAETAVAETLPQPLDTEPVNTSPVQQDDIPTFHEALVGDVRRLNPLLADLNPVEQDITALIYEGMMRLNQYGEPVNNLVEEWIVSSNGLEYVFTLRDDVLWQDGIPLSADDVIFTFSILSSPDFPGNPDQAGFWRTVEVQKLNDRQVRFRLTHPLGSFPSYLTVGLLPEHALRGTTAAQLATHPFNLSPIGTGPYQLETLRSVDGTRISQIDLRVAPVYRQRPEGQSGFAIDRIRFHLYSTFDDALNALNNNQVHALASTEMAQRQALLDSDKQAYSSLAPSIGILIYNWDEGDSVRFFQEIRVRTALQAALNRTGPVESRLGNQAVLANSPLLPLSWAYRANLPWQPVNPAAALDMIQSANIQTGPPPEEPQVDEGTIPPPTATPDPTQPLYGFTILTDDRPAVTALAQEIATQWSQLRLNVTVESQPQAVFQQRIEDGDFDAAIVELSLGADPDVYAYWHVGQYPEGRNYGGAADSRLSDILERARRESGGVARDTLYAEFQERFIDRGIAIPLYYPLFTYVVSDTIEGVQIGFISTPADRFKSIQNWTLR